MPLPTTELPQITTAIDAQAAPLALSALLDSQSAALNVVRSVLAEIDRGADIMAAAIRANQTLVYAAAGSSGLMVLADACELPGTFGIPPSAVRVFMAGGVPVDAYMPGDTEDDAGAAQAAAQSITPGDAVIVVSASGTTPYAVAIAQAAKMRGATVIAIANTPASRLLDLADVGICLATRPEAIAGSTRLGAATAQKAALNMMSSLMGVKLGHVYQGRMVNVVADNAKLVTRARDIVADIAGVSPTDAETALRAAGGNSKNAILIAKGCAAPAAADLLASHNGHLGPCLSSLTPNQKQKSK